MNAPLPFLNHTDDCVELVDGDGVVIWMNERRQRLLMSCDRHLAAGCAWLDLWDEPYREAAAAAVLAAATSGNGHFTASCSTDATTTTWWDVSVISLQHAGRAEQVISIARDITSYIAASRDREDALEEERQARLGIERENRKRDYALLVAAHELGAPLYAVRGWAQYLQLGNLEPNEFTEAVEAIGRNTERQHHLVERLLKVARFRSKSGSPSLLANPIDEILVDAIECVRPVASSKQIVIHSEIATTACVMADFDQMQRAFSNILYNSVKFTPSNGVITVLCSEESDCIRIEFSDTGAGIAPEFLEKAFEPFSQEGANHQPSMIGLGLGLSIVRRIVESHHGSIRVTSEGHGRGSTFIIDLPVMSRTTV